MASNFSGKWLINHDLSSEQKPLLKAMGRADWQISVIDKAQEDFELIHEVQEKNGKMYNVFTKNVRMFLNSSFLTIISKLIQIPFTEIKYNHTFTENKKTHYQNDEKGFGECESIVTYNPTKNVFTIRWLLKCGILICNHSLPDNDTFRIDMTLKQDTNSKDLCVHKVYKRIL